MFVKVVVPLLAVCLTVASAMRGKSLKDADINSPEVKKALRFAVAEYNADSNSEYTSEVVEVIKVQTQVVINVNYIFTVKMVDKYCPTAGSKNQCVIVADTVPRECELTVMVQTVGNLMDLLRTTC